MTDLVPIQESTDTWIAVLGPVGDLAGKLARTPFVPRAMQGNPAAVAAAILTGRELGLGPLTSLRGIDVIEGKPALTAQMLAARILAAGHRISWVQVTDQRATVRIERGDGLGEAEATWTIGDAQRAGLAGKKVWQQYPRHMLRARALSECAGMVCADVALGLDVSGAEPDDGDDRRFAPPPTVVRLEAPTGAAHYPDGTDDDPGASQAPAMAVPAEAEPTPDMITGPQLRKLGALIGELERAAHGGVRLSRDDRRELIGGLADRPGLESAKDLTSREASTVIDALTALVVAARSVDTATGEVVDAEVVEEPTAALRGDHNA